MTHPHRLHAQAAAWSLHTARTELDRAAAQEAAAIAAESAYSAADGLRAWQPLPGRSRGVHGDPVGGVALLYDRAPRVNRYATLAQSTTDTLRWLADQLHAPAGGDPLRRLQAAMPGFLPGTCAVLLRWLVEADERLRGALGLVPDLWPLPGAPACPVCSVRMLRAQTSAPDTAAWTVVCAAGCVCTGDGCPCGMPVRVEGVGHIWDRGSPLVAGAFAGVAPAQAA